MSSRNNPRKDQKSGRSAPPADTNLPVPPSKSAHQDSAVRGLFVVATPIGNLGDISERAKRALADAKLIACEDTRVSGVLLSRFGIATPTTPYHEHNAERVRPALLKTLREGAAVALISDAGTPLISDPGYKLVRACVDEGIPVTPVPGPSALLTALMVAGLPTDRFFFAGFLPNKSAARREALLELRSVPATLVFYESANRAADSLADMATVLGPRQAALCRELTKLHEETRRGDLPALAAGAISDPPRGEVVIVVDRAGQAAAASDEEVDAALRTALGEHRLRDAVDLVAASTGRPRREVYARALAVKGPGTQ